MNPGSVPVLLILLRFNLSRIRTTVLIFSKLLSVRFLFRLFYCLFDSGRIRTTVRIRPELS
jgi:hypothetical protein